MQPLWIPSERTVAKSNIHCSLQSQSFESYEQLYRWSIEEPAEFWGHVVDVLGIRFHHRFQRVLDAGNGTAAVKWFPEARLNIADSCFQANPSATVILTNHADGSIRKITYAEVRNSAHQVANGLINLGLKPRDAVAVFMPMTARSVPIYLGIILAGCVVVSVADSFSAEQLHLRLQIGKAKLIFTQCSFRRGNKQFELLERVVEADGPRAILVDEVSPTLGNCREEDLLWDAFLGEASFFSIALDPATPINILFSSGTTGEPKAIPWDHTTPIKAASDGYFHQDIHPNDVVAWPTNLGWMMGPWLIFATMINHAAIALFDGSPLDTTFGRFVQDSEVTILGVVPSLVLHWRETNCMEELDWSKIRHFSSTGECSSPEDMQYLSQLAGGKPIIEYCGGTEIGGGYMASTVVQENYPSTFSTPTLGSKCVVLDENGQKSNLGEVFLVPPTVGFSHRLINRDHDEVYYCGTPQGPSGELLRRHGDHFEQLSNGYFRSHGRADDTMNIGGIKVSAAEIERVLAQIPEVKDVAAVAVEPIGGGPSRLHICAVASRSLPKDAQAIQTRMQQEIKTTLNPLFKIYAVHWLEYLPRTASNKIIRRELRKRCANLSQ